MATIAQIKDNENEAQQAQQLEQQVELQKINAETGKAIERERDAAIKRKTLALEERINDFKEMLRERAVRIEISLILSVHHSVFLCDLNMNIVPVYFDGRF